MKVECNNADEYVIFAFTHSVMNMIHLQHIQIDISIRNLKHVQT